MWSNERSPTSLPISEQTGFMPDQEPAMKTIILSIPVFAFLLFNAVAQQPDYSQLRNEAEAQYAQGSYARANELYAKVDKSKLSAADSRWVEFRLADTSWRAQAAT